MPVPAQLQSPDKFPKANLHSSWCTSSLVYCLWKTVWDSFCSESNLWKCEMLNRSFLKAQTSCFRACPWVICLYKSKKRERPNQCCGEGGRDISPPPSLCLTITTQNLHMKYFSNNNNTVFAWESFFPWLSAIPAKLTFYLFFGHTKLCTPGPLHFLLLLSHFLPQEAHGCFVFHIPVQMSLPWLFGLN